MKGWSYRELHRELRASLLYRRFTRFYEDPIPDFSNLCRAFALFGKQGTEEIHQRIVRALLGLLALGGWLLPDSAQEKSSLGQRVSVRGINVFLLSDGSGIWSKPPSVEFYKRRAAIAAMAFRYAKHHPGHDYRMAASIGVGVNDAYPTITVTALDIATYIQNRDRSIPWNVCRLAGEYMETWVNYSRLGFDTLAASEILSQGVSKGLNGKIE
jgi:IS5 family transposase